MMQFREYDVVRVTRLEKPHRPIDGSRSVMRQPQIGDEGTIVHIPVSITDKTIYIVECVDNEGSTIWLADFSPEELELIIKPSDKQSN